MTVRVYRSDDVDAPVLTGLAGSLVGLLDACLVNGYGTGGDEKLPAGWAIEFTGTNKRVYRAAVGNRFRYRVLDDGSVGTYTTRKGAIRGYESMSDVDTGTDPFGTNPTAGHGGYILKSSTADAVAKNWLVVADEQACLLFTQYLPSNPYAAYFFGDPFSVMAADSWCSFLYSDPSDGNPATSASTINFFAREIAVTAPMGFNAYTANGDHAGWRAVRTYDAATKDRPVGLGSTFHRGAHSGNTNVSIYKSSQCWRSMSLQSRYGGVVDSAGVGLMLRPAYLFETFGGSASSAASSFVVRAQLPFYEALQSEPFASFTIIENALPGRDLITMQVGGVYNNSASDPFQVVTTEALTTGVSTVFVDITGPWR